MIVVMNHDATEKQIAHIIERIEQAGLTPKPSQGTERTIIGIIGDERVLRQQVVESFPGVEKVLPVLSPFKLASREFHPEPTVINISGTLFGQGHFTVIAGPCSVENEDRMLLLASAAKTAGAGLLRGGAFKPRTSPYTFQGLGETGLKILYECGQKVGLPIVTEVMDTRDVDLVNQYTDMLQIGARNMQNFNLLKEVGKTDKPILLKRGMMATIKELLMSAEYIMSQGNEKIVLCERGIRTFEDETRNTLDISSVPIVHRKSHLPIIVDPSHAAGYWRWVEALSLAALAAGADGLMLEIHDCPEEAYSDGKQSLYPKKFTELMQKIKQLAPVLNKTI